MGARPEEAGALWYDDAAGPVVRPYAVTRGRTCPQPSDARLDPVALVAVEDEAVADFDLGAQAAGQPGDALFEEHAGLLERCREGPLSVAELATDSGLPLGVVRVLLGDLLECGRVRIICPSAPAQLPDIGVLKHVISGLRAL